MTSDDSEELVETVEVSLDTEVSPAPVVITEQEVLFGTAAASRLPTEKAPSRWITMLRSAFAASRSDARSQRRHYPPRYDFLEASRMSREMHRL